MPLAVSFGQGAPAFTVEEVRSQIKQAGLDLDVIQISDRHMLIRGLLP